MAIPHATQNDIIDVRPFGRAITEQDSELLIRTAHLEVFRHALPAKTKQLIAVAVAHVTQCPYCIRGHTKSALHHGATSEEIMEAIWVAAEMRAGGSYAHSVIALDVISHGHAPQSAKT